MSQDPVRIYVGADRSQQFAVKVLEHSIRRHTQLPVELHAMIDLPIKEPQDPRHRQRTGFSFSRFCIPKLAGYRGKAIYLDADMLVFNDISELWSLPFGEAKIQIQKELEGDQSLRERNPSFKRIRQCSVMLLDCEKLDWDIEKIIADIDAGKYGYEDLMYQLCILEDQEIKCSIPFEWNSLEQYHQNTRLIHYTDMNTQPWVSPFNKNDECWYHEMRLMLEDGTLEVNDLKREIELGYFRPSLTRDILTKRSGIRSLQRAWDYLSDKLSGYRMHQKVHAANKARLKAAAS